MAIGDTESDQLHLRMTINILPDDVLLEIFSYVAIPQDDSFEDVEVSKGPTVYENGWHTLVHVCKRWRCIVFASPLRLDLRIVCTNRRPVGNMLDIWPPLPIHIHAYHRAPLLPLPGVENLMAALNEHNRVYGIHINGVPDSLLKRIVAIKSFPVLKELGLVSYDQSAPVLPDSFLGGSAPHLRRLWLKGIPFPGLGKLLLSTTDLIDLYLTDIPHIGYISPKAMVSSLSTLTRLERLQVALKFLSPGSQADQDPPPLPRIVLPALTQLLLKVDNEYVEDFLSAIDAPLLESMDLTFFDQLVHDTSQLRHFISRTEQFKTPDRASIQLYDNNVTIGLFQRRLLNISCKTSDLQIYSLTHLYNSTLSPLPTLESLEIRDHRTYWEDNLLDIVLWLELLRLFTSVKDLVLSATLFRFVAPALGELAEEMVAGVLPALQNIFLEGPRPSEAERKAIRSFISTCHLLDRSTTVYHRDNEFQEYVRWEVYGQTH
jgi:hypothetical protein